MQTVGYSAAQTFGSRVGVRVAVAVAVRVAAAVAVLVGVRVTVAVAVLVGVCVGVLSEDRTMLVGVLTDAGLGSLYSKGSSALCLGQIGGQRRIWSFIPM